MSNYRWIMRPAALAAYGLCALGVPAFAGEECDIWRGEPTSFGAEVWEVNGTILDDGRYCHLVEPAVDAGYLQHDVTYASRSIEVEFVIDTEDLIMEMGDVFRLCEIEGESGIELIRLRLLFHDPLGAYRLLVNWASDDESGAAHPQIDLPSSSTTIRARWMTSTVVGNVPQDNGEIAVFLGEDPMPLFVRENLIVGADFADHIRVGVIGGEDPGTAGAFGFKINELSFGF